MWFSPVSLNSWTSRTSSTAQDEDLPGVYSFGLSACTYEAAEPVGTALYPGLPFVGCFACNSPACLPELAEYLHCGTCPTPGVPVACGSHLSS